MGGMFQTSVSSQLGEMEEGKFMEGGVSKVRSTLSCFIRHDPAQTSNLPLECYIAYGIVVRARAQLMNRGPSSVVSKHRSQHLTVF